MLILLLLTRFAVSGRCEGTSPQRFNPKAYNYYITFSYNYSQRTQVVCSKQLQVFANMMGFL
jgi:hypothetical protein